MTDLDLTGLDDAELRLVAVRCARRAQPLMTDPRSIAALDVAERHARGEATDEELRAACDAASDAAVTAAWAAWDAAAGAKVAALWAARAAAWAVEAPWTARAAASAAASAAWWAVEPAAAAASARAEERAVQQEILKQIREGRE